MAIIVVYLPLGNWFPLLTHWPIDSSAEQRAPQWLICMWHMRPPYRQTCHAYQTANHLASLSLYLRYDQIGMQTVTASLGGILRRVEQADFYHNVVGAGLSWDFNFVSPHSTWL